jgi:hypothetical protein
VALAVAGVVVAGGYLLITARAMAAGNYHVWGGMVALPVVALLSVPMLRSACRREVDPRIKRLILWAFGLKLIAALPRYWMAFALYDGFADATGYNDFGRQIADSIWAGRPVFDVGPMVGTGFLRLLTGLVYTVTGPSLLAGFVVFSWLGFWGMYLFYRAFRLALPDEDVLLYARLVFLLPSLLFWPSSIGKEAAITLTLGVTAYGAARIMTWASGGFPLLLLGLTGTALIRPHVAVLAFLAISLAYVLRRARPDATALTPIGKALGVTVLLLVGVLVMRSALKFLGVDSFNADTVNGWLDETARRTDQGGSSFAVIGSGTPLQYPAAVLTVLFRPLPFEATSLQALVTSLEGVFLLGLGVRHRRRLLRVLAGLRRRPYVAMCIIYTLLFSYAFSQISNFGIIARQRVQVLPFAVALICVRTRQEKQSESGAATVARPASPSPTALSWPVNGSRTLAHPD